METEELPSVYRAALVAGIRSACGCGPVAGFPVIDVRFVVTRVKWLDGVEAAAFEAAGHRAAQMALERVQAAIVEPIMRVTIDVPGEHAGAVYGDLGRMRATVINTASNGSDLSIEALVPLAETFGYITKLRSLTAGTATFSMEFDSYAAVPAATQEHLAR